MSNIAKNVTTLDDTPKSAAPATKVEVTRVVNKLSGDFTGKRCIVTVAAGADDVGQEAVFVSVQGVAFQLPRGVPCNVPEEVANVLGDAIERRYITDKTSGVSRVADVPRYMFLRQDVAEPVAA